jgi:5-methylcytosine-specific restriction endonuclease McrA
MNIDFICEKCGTDMYLEYERSSSKYISDPINVVKHYDEYAGTGYHTWNVEITCMKCGNKWEIDDGD